MWDWLKRLWRRIRNWLKLNRSRSVASTSVRSLSLVEYENHLQSLLQEVAQGKGWGQIQAFFIVREIDPKDLARWLHQQGDRWLEHPAQHRVLGERLTMLGRIGRGDLAEVAAKLGRQLAPVSPSQPLPTRREPALHPFIPPSSLEFQPSVKSASSHNTSAASTVVPDAIFHPVLPIDLPLLQNNSQNPDEWIQQGIEFYQQIKNAAALECYERALKLMQPETDPTKAQVVEGLRQAAKRQFKEALPLLQSLPTSMPEYASLLDEIQTRADNSSRAEKLYQQGANRYNVGDLEGAIALYEQALVIQPDHCVALNDTGVALFDLGCKEEAIQWYDQALAIRHDYYLPLNNKGAALADLGYKKEAIQWYDQALAIQSKYHQALSNKGNALSNLGRKEEAIECYTQSIESSNTYWRAWAERGLRAGDRSRGDLPHRVSERLPSVQYRMVDRYGFGGECANYREGLRYIKQDKPVDGWKPWQRKLAEGEGKLYQHLGKANYRRGRKEENPFPWWRSALSYYQQAEETLTEQAFPEAFLELLEAQIEILLNLRETEQARGLQQRAAESLQGLLNRTSRVGAKQHLMRKFSGLRQLAVTTLVQAGEMAVALQTAEQEKCALAAWLLTRQETTATALDIPRLVQPGTAVISWHLSPAALTTFVLLPGQAPRVIFPESRPPDSTDTPSPLQSAILQQLKDWEDWLKSWDTAYDAYCKAVAKEANSPWRKEMGDRLQRLSDLLCIQQIEQAWADSPTDRLILIPHRDLHRLPLPILFTRPYTQRDYVASVLPNAAVGLERLGQTAPLPTEVSPLLVGNPQHVSDAEKKLIPLPFAELEVAVLQQQWSAAQRLVFCQGSFEGSQIPQNFPNFNFDLQDAPQIKIDKPLGQGEVSYDVLLTELKRHNTVFHFAGHAVYQPKEPTRSTLYLSGTDTLTVQQLVDSEVDLRSYELVSLAACETAMTGSLTITTEYVGLVSAFLRCGAKSVVSSLWRVEAAATTLLMLRFYDYWQMGDSLPTALHRAQQWLRSADQRELQEFCQEQQHQFSVLTTESFLLKDLLSIIEDMKSEIPYNHPYYWAAFILTGQ